MYDLKIFNQPFWTLSKWKVENLYNEIYHLYIDDKLFFQLIFFAKQFMIRFLEPSLFYLIKLATLVILSFYT